MRFMSFLLRLLVLLDLLGPNGLSPEPPPPAPPPESPAPTLGIGGAGVTVGGVNFGGSGNGAAVGSGSGMTGTSLTLSGNFNQHSHFAESLEWVMADSPILVRVRLESRAADNELTLKVLESIKGTLKKGETIKLYPALASGLPPEALVFLQPNTGS